MKISVQGEQCFPIVKLMAEHLKAAGFDAYPDPDGFPRGQDILWYVGCFRPIEHTFQSMKTLYPKIKFVLQWSGSDILWTPPDVPHGNAHVYIAPCRNWALEAAEKFHLDCKSIELTPIRVHPLSPLPEKPRILIYGHWDAEGGAKYQLPMILEECRRHRADAEFHVIGDGWRSMHVNHITFHNWIHDYDVKVEFFKSMSGLIYMPKPHELHKYGGFVSLTPIEFAQMGRKVVRNGSYYGMFNTEFGFPQTISDMLAMKDDWWGSDKGEEPYKYYAREFAPEKCQNTLREIIDKNLTEWGD
jgi:hypothetical protein